MTGVHCDFHSTELGVDKVKRLVWLLNTPFEDELSEASFLEEGLTESGDLLVEIGPRYSVIPDYLVLNTLI